VTGFPEMAALLLDHGATIDDNESLYHSLEHEDSACFELLLARGANPNGTNALNHALDFEDVSRIRALLGHGADPDETFQDHGTSLHVAIAKGVRLEIVELLLEHGADLAARRPDGRTPYQVALLSGHEEAAALLHARGAPGEAGTIERIFSACGRGDREAARVERTAEPDVFAATSDAVRRVVHEWAKQNRHEAIAALLAVGFPPDAPGVSGETALHQAAWFGWPESVRALLEGGAPLEAVETTYGCTPLGWAAHGSDNWPNPDGDYPRVVALLLEAGADVTARNSWNESVIALAGGRTDVVELLREAGAPE
jgi:ankyrin repeat protein